MTLVPKPDVESGGLAGAKFRGRHRCRGLRAHPHQSLNREMRPTRRRWAGNSISARKYARMRRVRCGMRGKGRNDGWRKEKGSIFFLRSWSQEEYVRVLQERLLAISCRSRLERSP